MNKKSRKPRKPSTYKGLPLIDADKDLEICVTKSDVSKSRKNDPANCAAANSLKRALETEVEVHVSRTYVKQGKKWIRFITPNSISREITSFDRAGIFEPGDFLLKAPSKHAKLGVHRGRSYEKNKTKRPAHYHVTANIREAASKS